MNKQQSQQLITVITVVLNDKDNIENTIRSVLSLSYSNIEYVIIDGGSSDGTLEIIKKYENRLARLISEPDKGIYDAMNKGISIAEGDWVIFMNSGDCFYDKDVLSFITKDTSIKDYGIVYGDTEIRYDQERKRKLKARELTSIWKGSCFTHQSALISLPLQKKHLYNTSDCLVADFRFFYSMYTMNVKFLHVSKVISSVSAKGLSDLRRVDVIVGWWNIVTKKWYVNLYYVKRVILEMIKGPIKKLIHR